MAEKNPYEKGTPEWQQWFNDQVAQHDEQAKKSDDEGQQFEIAPPPDDSSK